MLTNVTIFFSTFFSSKCIWNYVNTVTALCEVAMIWNITRKIALICIFAKNHIINFYLILSWFIVFISYIRKTYIFVVLNKMKSKCIYIVLLNNLIQFKNNGHMVQIKLLYAAVVILKAKMKFGKNSFTILFNELEVTWKRILVFLYRMLSLNNLWSYKSSNKDFCVS